MGMKITRKACKNLQKCVRGFFFKVFCFKIVKVSLKLNYAFLLDVIF